MILYITRICIFIVFYCKRGYFVVLFFSKGSVPPASSVTIGHAMVSIIKKDTIKVIVFLIPFFLPYIKYIKIISPFLSLSAIFQVYLSTFMATSAKNTKNLQEPPHKRPLQVIKVSYNNLGQSNPLQI